MGKKLTAQDTLARQMATAMWIIDVLALRVGGEKGEDEADTVGCCSLRCEHMTFHEDASVMEMELKFLGKDSMQFLQTISFTKYDEKLRKGTIGEQIYKNLRQFTNKKRPSDQVFDRLQPSVLNA